MSRAVRAVVSVVLVGVAAAFAGPIGANALAGFLFSTGLAMGLGVLAQSLASTPRTRRLGQDVEYFGTVEPRRILYGKQKISGMNVIPPWTSGEKNKNLHQVLALPAHEVSDIQDVYFGEQVIASSTIAAVANTSDSGNVTSGTFANLANIRRYKGSAGETVDYILNQAFPAQWPSTSVGTGVAKLCIQFKLDEEKYSGGKPDISCIVLGKIVYDPRLDPVAGASPNTAAYRAYSTNNALCLTDYLLDTTLGLGQESTLIDWDLVLAAANDCDEDVVIPGSVTQKRYTCNLLLEVAATEEQRRQNITDLAASMMGQCMLRGGKWRMFAGGAGSSSFTLTGDDLAGAFSIRTEVPSHEAANYITGMFVDRDKNWQLMPFEPRSNSTYETDDGGRYAKDVMLPGVDNQNEAQRDSIIISKRTRCKKQLTGLFSMSAFTIRPWDVGTFTFAELDWDNQLVRCTAWDLDQEGRVEATFLEEVAAHWDDPAVGDYISSTALGSPVQTGYAPDEPVDFTATDSLDSIRFHFNYPPGIAFPVRAYIYEATLNAAFSTAVRVSPNFLGNSFTLVKADTTRRHYWVTLQSWPQLVESDPVGPAEAGALSISSGFRVTVSASSIYKNIFSTGLSTGTSSSVTATGVNGTLPYTSTVWTRVSGSTDITANSPNAVTTNFSVTGLTLGSTKTAVFRCTFTATGGATAYKDVNVTFVRESTQ